jgi:hypothetical protein
MMTVISLGTFEFPSGKYFENAQKFNSSPQNNSVLLHLSNKYYIEVACVINVDQTIIWKIR